MDEEGQAPRMNYHSPVISWRKKNCVEELKEGVEK